jgi:hypothetical protein
VLQNILGLNRKKGKKGQTKTATSLLTVKEKQKKRRKKGKSNYKKRCKKGFRFREI